MWVDSNVDLNNELPPGGSGDDEETFEETLEETLEGTFEGTLQETFERTTLEGTFVEALRLPTSAETMVLNATKALALAMARTAPVKVSPSMAFSNAIDMDNLCRVSTEDSTFSTIYRPGQKSYRRGKRGKLYGGISRDRTAVSEDDIDFDDFDESITLQSWNTLLTDRHSEYDEVDEEDDSHASTYGMFNVETTIGGSEERLGPDNRSEDIRDQPEQLVVFTVERNFASSDVSRPKKYTGWLTGIKNKSKNDEAQLTSRHQKKHVEVVVNDSKNKKRFKGGERIVRFLSPIARIISKNKNKMEQPASSVNSASSASTMQLMCEESVNSTRCEDGSLPNGFITLNCTVDQPSVLDPEVSSKTDNSEQSVVGGEGTEHSISPEPGDEHTPPETPDKDDKSLSAEKIVNNLKRASDLVRDASNGNGFEVEVSATSFMSVLLLRDASVGSKKGGHPFTLQRAQSVRTSRTALSRSRTFHSTKTTASKMTRSKSLPNSKLFLGSTTKNPSPSDDGSQSVDTWGSYVDDDESKVLPLIVPRNISMKRGDSSSAMMRQTSLVRSLSSNRSISTKRVSSANSVLFHSRSDLASQPIQRIEEEVEDGIESKLDTTEAAKLIDNRPDVKEEDLVTSQAPVETIKDMLQECALTTDTDESIKEASSRVDLAGTSPDVKENDNAVTLDIAKYTLNGDAESDDEKLVNHDVTESSDEKQTTGQNERGEVEGALDNTANNVSVEEDDEEEEIIKVNTITYVVSSIVEEDADCDSITMCQLSGFEVLEISSEVDGLVEI
jgi:hypothetical protein